MKIHDRRLAYSLVFGIALVSASTCSSKQTAPTPTPFSLAVKCDTAALNTIGQQAHCQARLTLSDSTTQDQTSSAQWSSSDPTTVSVSAGGVISAVAPGSAAIAATVQGLSGRQTITVSMPCAFSISPAALSFSSGGGSEIVSVVAAPSGCSPSAWTAATTGSGLTFAPAAGDGNGVVTVTAVANSGAAQMQTAMIAGQPLAVTIATAPPPPMRTLSLTLTQGEELSGPWAGTVTALNGFSCMLSQRDKTVSCPPLNIQDGTRVDLLVTLAPQLASIGHPIRRATGCDLLTEKVCTVFMNRDKAVTISIGWDVAPIR